MCVPRGDCRHERPEHSEVYLLELDMLVVRAGIRPRDKLARDSGLAVGQRGGVVVNNRMQSSDPRIFALGEVACYKDLCYGVDCSWLRPGVRFDEGR